MHVKLREVLQADEARPERAQRLLDVAGRVGLEGVDADGEVVQAGLVERFDDAVAQEEAVGDDADVGLAAGVADELGDVGVHEGLAAQHRDVGRAEAVKSVDPLLEDVRGDGVGEAVVLAAVAAGEVAAAGNDELGVHGGVGEENARDGREQVLNLQERCSWKRRRRTST